MTASLPVFASVAAHPALAGWMQRLLVPVIQACKFDAPVPAEIRPTGRFGGWASGREYTPDGRVALSSHVSFWTAERIISVYLHECTHRLLWDHEVLNHGPEFLCLNSVLLLRSTSFFKTDSVVTQIGLYDFQDRPEALVDDPSWRGIVLDWSLAAAIELADSDMTAEALVPVVCQRWAAYTTERQANAERAFAAKRLAVQQVQQRAIVHDEILRSRSLARWLASVGWFSFIAVSYFIFKRGIP